MDKIQKINKAYYTKYAKEWSSQKTNSFVYEKQFRLFNSLHKAKASILDIGCSSGIHIPLFLGIGKKLKYEGFDITPNFLKIAKNRYPHMSFKNGSLLEKKTLPRKKYDGFWSAATLMHIQEDKWSEMLKNIESIMKKGAIGFISLPEVRPNKRSKKDPRHFTLKTSKEYKEIFKHRGWKVIKSGIIPFLTRRSVKWNWFIVKLP